MPLFDHLNKSVQEKLGILKENLDKKNEIKVDQNSKKEVKKKKSKKPRIKVEIKDPVEELLLLRSKLDEILLNDNGSTMSYKVISSFIEKIENLEYFIIDAFIDEKIEKHEMSRITDKKSRDKILNALGDDFFSNKTDVNFSTIKSNEVLPEIFVEKNIAEIKYEAYCEAIWCDGVFSESEANWLEEKRNYLKISFENAKKIQKKVIKSNIPKTPNNQTDLQNYNFEVLLSDKLSVHDPHYQIELSFEKQGCLIIINKNNFIFSEKDFNDYNWLKPYIVDGIVKFYYDFLKTRDGSNYFEIKNDLLKCFSDLKINYVIH